MADPWVVTKEEPAPAWTVVSEEPLPPGGDSLTVPAGGTGQSTLDQLRGRDPSVDYSTGAPIDVRYNMFRAGKGPEEEKYLTNTYGAGNFKKDAGGNWLVKQGDAFVPVYPSGVTESLKNTGAAIGSVVPTIAGGIGGGLAGAAVGGPAGGVAGAFLGAGGAQAADEGVKAVQGFYDKPLSGLMQSIGTEGALAGGFQALPIIKHAVAKPLYGATSRVLGGASSVTPESRAVTQSLERFGVTPPISSVAPGMKTFEYDRRLRNMLMTDPKLAGRMGAMDARTSEVLEGFGFTGPALKQALKTIQDKTTALSGREAGTAVTQRLRGREVALSTEEATQLQFAQESAQRAYDIVRNASRQPTGRLGEDVATAFTGAREEFGDLMRQTYAAIDQAAGARPYVDLSAVSRAAEAMVAGMDQQAVPPVIARLIRGEEALVSFEEAHNLRTTLREMAKIKDLSPIGQRRGNLRQMAALVDDALLNVPDDALGQQVARQLRAADQTYGEGIRRFTKQEVNNLVRDVRQGRMPNAEDVADLLVDKSSADATRQIWSMLPQDIQTRVRTADLKNMIDAASVTGKDGRQTLDPDTLLRTLNNREEVNSFVYPRALVQQLREMATDFQALGGKVDVTNLPPNQIRNALQQALGAKKALETEARTNPRIALRSDNPELVDAGARYFLSPGNEARTLAGANMLAGPEWEAVQRYAIQDLLKSAVRPKGLGRTVSGGAIDDYLGKYTQAQQKALYGSRLPDVKLIAQQAKALFPELGDEFGGSLAAASIKGNLPKTSAIRAYAWSYFAGKLADSPQLAKLLAGQLRQDPVKARGVLSYMLQSGADLAMNAAEKTPALARQEREGVQAVEQLSAPVAKPRPKAVPATYQGPD